MIESQRGMRGGTLGKARSGMLREPVKDGNHQP